MTLDLPAAIASAAAAQPIPVSAEAAAAVLEFVARRLEQLLVDGGCTPEVVRAVLAERGTDPFSAAQSARDLQVVFCHTSRNLAATSSILTDS